MKKIKILQMRNAMRTVDRHGFRSSSEDEGKDGSGSEFERDSDEDMSEGGESEMEEDSEEEMEEGVGRPAMGRMTKSKLIADEASSDDYDGDDEEGEEEMEEEMEEGSQVPSLVPIDATDRQQDAHDFSSSSDYTSSEEE